jgi:lipopolysaccharide transport system ATP-binding protein
MSSDIAIKVENLSKCYQIYEQPRDRLKQFVMPRIQRALGKQPKQYYREFWALKDVSFEVKKGEAVSIVGKNGSGKSTFLQLICGTLNQTAGTIHTIGRIAALLELGSGFNSDFSGRENVFLNGSLLGFSQAEIEARFDEIAAFADIGDFLDRPVKTYSSGMFVRLAFSVQVLLDPEILIVDEALAVGDALFQKRCYQRIDKFLTNGGTLLFVSHDQEAVRTLTNRAILLSQGTVIATGTSSDVVREYRRQLHEEETSKFLHLSNSINDARISDSTEYLTKEHSKYSFGSLEAEILNVGIFNSEGVKSNYFIIGQRITLAVTVRVNREMSSFAVAFRIRNREGVKVTSWGTLNEDMEKIAVGKSDLFWSRRFNAGDIFEVFFEAECRLGANFYEVQATVTHEGDPFYGQQTILHWVDEAAFFSVGMRQKEYVVGGIGDFGFRSKDIVFRDL